MSNLSLPDIPKLEGEALAAVEHRGSHIQIIAAAGSGKTEVVSQRVASLLADGARPESIVAFTFTEKAATELKAREFPPRPEKEKCRHCNVRTLCGAAV